MCLTKLLLLIPNVGTIRVILIVHLCGNIKDSAVSFSAPTRAIPDTACTGNMSPLSLLKFMEPLLLYNLDGSLEFRSFSCWPWATSEELCGKFYQWLVSVNDAFLDIFSFLSTRFIFAVSNPMIFITGFTESEPAMWKIARIPKLSKPMFPVLSKSFSKVHYL